jgi:hypothetical protein
VTFNQCPLSWPVCPDCLGEPLRSTAGMSSCPRCQRRFPDAARAPCPDVATATIRDGAGTDARMCLSHAVRAAVMIVGSNIVDGFTLAAVEAVRGLPERDADTARRVRAAYDQAMAEFEGAVTPLSPRRQRELATFRQELESLVDGIPKARS